MTSQPPLFQPDYPEPPNTRTLVTRMPGTIDAPCMCERETCMWPFAPTCWGLTDTDPEQETA